MIAVPLLRWYHRQESKNLPWQCSDPYKVWVSEIMLQQTQVNTVLDYYPRFISAFPRVEDLAAASTDKVMSLWSGLGYYARAYNLHQAAKIVVTKHKGIVPKNIVELMRLPGIGRSTAGAILSLAHNMHHPILDTNVKRVLVRYFALREKPGSRLDAQLWTQAEKSLPHQEIGLYNQALMNLGASLCRPLSPRCGECPLSTACQARALGLTEELPYKIAKAAKPQRTAYFALVMNSRQAVLLERRPPIGIWRSLWCPPQFDNLAQLKTRMHQQFGTTISQPQRLPSLRHGFSHFTLLIRPLLFQLHKDPSEVTEDTQLWYSMKHSEQHNQQPGLPAPIKRLMKSMDRH